MYIIHLSPMGRMTPPSRKHWIQSPNAKPPQPPMKYFACCQKKIATPPPAIPAMEHAKTKTPRIASVGGFTASRTPNLRMRTRHTSANEYQPIRKNEDLRKCGAIELSHCSVHEKLCHAPSILVAPERTREARDDENGTQNAETGVYPCVENDGCGGRRSGS